MKKKAKIIEFPIEKTLEIQFMQSLSQKQLFQFFQIMENIAEDESKNSAYTLNNMLNQECKNLKQENARLKKIIGRLKYQQNKKE